MRACTVCFPRLQCGAGLPYGQWSATLNTQSEGSRPAKDLCYRETVFDGSDGTKIWRCNYNEYGELTLWDFS